MFPAWHEPLGALAFVVIGIIAGVYFCEKGKHASKDEVDGGRMRGPGGSCSTER